MTRHTKLPLPLVADETVKLCVKGTWQEMSEGCNVLQPAVVPNPGWFASIHSPETLEVLFYPTEIPETWISAAASW